MGIQIGDNSLIDVVSLENMLRHYVPEVNSVEQEVEEGEGMDLLDMATMNR